MTRTSVEGIISAFIYIFPRRCRKCLVSEIFNKSCHNPSPKSKVQIPKSKVERTRSDSILLLHPPTHQQFSFKILFWIVTKSSPTLVLYYFLIKYEVSSDKNFAKNIGLLTLSVMT